MEEQQDETASVLPAPMGIACQGCRYGVPQVRRLTWSREVWWYCRLIHSWAWAGDPEEGYPEECGAREPAQPAQQAQQAQE
jgi:hypothetical protein